MWQPQEKKHGWEAPAAAAGAGGGRASGEDAKAEQGGARARAALGRGPCAGQAAACGCGRDKWEVIARTQFQPGTRSSPSGGSCRRGSLDRGAGGAWRLWPPPRSSANFWAQLLGGALLLLLLLAAPAAAMEPNGTFLACNSKSGEVFLCFSSLILSKSFICPLLFSSPPFSTSLFSHLDVLGHFIAVTERDDGFCPVICVGRKGALAGEASASSEKWIQIFSPYGKLRAGWVLCWINSVGSGGDNRAWINTWAQGLSPGHCKY